MQKQEPVNDLIDNFTFILVGAGSKFPFRSYVSSIDPTNAEPGVLIAGSQNTLITLRRNVAVRPGLKRRGIADSTLAGTKSSYEWNASTGITHPLRVNNGNLEVEVQVAAGYEWFNLMTGLTLTRFVFVPWWNDTLKKDQLLFVKGDTVIHEWSGGVGIVAAVSNASGFISAIDQPNAASMGFDSSGGTGYVVGDSLTVTGGAATIYVDAVSPGGVASATLQSGGTGYAVNDIIALATPANGNAAYVKVLTVDGSGVVLTFSVLTAGSGYVADTINKVAGSGGGGSGFYAFVTGIGNTVTQWHIKTNGSGYSGSSTNVPLTGGTGTGATLHILTVGNYMVTLAGTQSIAQLGFEGAGGAITINGTTYTYAVSNQSGGQSFVGLSADPSGEAVGSVVLQPIVTSNNLPDPTNLQFTNDFIQVINNQLHVGCYQSRFVYVSSNTDYTDFSVPGTRIQGSPDLLTLDSNVRGIAIQPTNTAQVQNAVISGGIGDWYTVVRSQITVATTLEEQVSVTKSESADLATALAHEFIDNIGGNIIFLDQNNQLREFGTVRNVANPVFPLLSLDVYTELKGLNFTGGHMRAIADEDGETVYIVCPLSGIDYMYQIRQRLDLVGNLTAERLWQPPQVRGLSRIALISGVTYGHSNSQPQLYQLWETNQYHDDSPGDESLPYECHALLAYLNGGRTSLVKFDKLFTEGYMTQGSVVGCTVLMEYEGSKNNPSLVLNNPAKGQNKARFYVASNDASLGENSLGSNPIGDGLAPAGGDAALLPKFRCIRYLTAQEIFEYALDVNSNTADTQWELLCIGVNQVASANRPVNLSKTT